MSLVFGDQGFPVVEIWFEQQQSSSLWMSQLVVLELSDVLARPQRKGKGGRSSDQIAGMHFVLSEFGKERLGLLEPTAVPLRCVVPMPCAWLMKDPMPKALKRLC